MLVLINTISGVFELVTLAAPEIMFFFLAAIGMVLFGSGMLGPLVQRLLGTQPAEFPAKKILEEEEDQLTAMEKDESAEKELLTALREKNRSEAIRIWRERKFVMGVPSTMLLVDMLGSLRESGSPARAFVIELQQACEKNPNLCEGDAMECFFLALDTEKEDQGLVKALAVALEEVDRLTPKLRMTLIELALRRDEGDGLEEAMEILMELPSGVRLPAHLASRVLCLAGTKGRLPGAAAVLQDVQVAWSENALDASMAEASAQNNAELCIQLHKAAMNLNIPRSSKDYELLFGCLERSSSKTLIQLVADDLMQHDPFLEISEKLGLLLLRNGAGEENPALTARVLGRSG